MPRRTFFYAYVVNGWMYRTLIRVLCQDARQAAEEVEGDIQQAFMGGVFGQRGADGHGWGIFLPIDSQALGFQVDAGFRFDGNDTSLQLRAPGASRL